MLLASSIVTGFSSLFSCSYDSPVTLTEDAETFILDNGILTAPAYVSPRPSGMQPAPVTDWQRDAKFYQFWTPGNVNGTFEISKLRPGR